MRMGGAQTDSFDRVFTGMTCEVTWSQKEFRHQPTSHGHPNLVMALSKHSHGRDTLL